MSRSRHWYRHYHPDSLRLNGLDDRRSAWYFVTICSERRIPFFGGLQTNVVGLSAAACIATQEWQRTLQVRPYVRLDGWIVMPHHVHGWNGITTESSGHDGIRSTDTSDDAPPNQTQIAP